MNVASTHACSRMDACGIVLLIVLVLFVMSRPQLRTVTAEVLRSREECMTNLTRRLASLVGIVFVTMAMGCASAAKQESTGEYLDDTVITTKVKAALFNELLLKSSEVNVETYRGVVQLSGFVSSTTAVDTAVGLARSVRGVKSVKNDMRLK